MTLLNITDEDLLRGTLLKPGWYPVHINEVAETAAKTDGSTFWKMRSVIRAGENKGVPLDFGFSEKAPGFAIPFLKAITGHDVKAGNANLALASGRDLDVYVTNGVYNGKPTNNVTDYRKPS